LLVACIACHGFLRDDADEILLDDDSSTTPGMPCTELSSTLASMAPTDGGRTTAP